MRKLIFLLTVVLYLPAASRAESVKTEYVEAELVSEVTTFQPGTPFWVAVRLAMAPHWHTYWRYSGDAGLPTTVAWELPDGFTASPLQWPAPSVIVVGGLVNIGYEDEVLLLSKITPPTDLPPDTVVTLKATVEWLVCKEACIPGDAEIATTLQTSSEGQVKLNETWTTSFAAARDQWPLNSEEWSISAQRDSEQVSVTIIPPEWASGPVEDALFLPYEHGVVNFAIPQVWQATEEGYTLTFNVDKNAEEPPSELKGIFLSQSGWRGPNSERALEVLVPFKTPSVAGPVEVDWSVLWKHLLGALLGGLILNLMPCVFPILSIKILGFMNQAGEGRQAAKHGAVFSLGVLVSFWILAGLLLGLRAAGEQVGWGFQLQSPPVVISLAAVMFCFGLNLFGVFEVGTGLGGVGAGVSSKSSYSGSFFSGFLATAIATPCTAPFMGAALGFALTMPPLVSFAVFTCVALGMASPYMLLSSFPALLKFLPKPGAWMVTLKQFFGFILMATVIWLAAVLANQTSSTGVLFLLAGLLLMALGCWVLGRWGHIGLRAFARYTARLFALVFLAGGLYVAIANQPPITPDIKKPGPIAGEGVAWGPFDKTELDKLLEQGQPVIINFTATWCLSCQVNERVAFSSVEVQQRIKELGVVPIKADWTRRDPEITQMLSHFGRSGVPLYVLYGPGPGAKPRLLPALLTPQIVLNALDSIQPTRVE